MGYACLSLLLGAAVGSAEARGRPGAALSLREVLAGCRTAGKALRSSAGRFRIEIQDNRTPSKDDIRGHLPTRIEGTWATKGARLREETVRTFPPLSREDQAAHDRARDRTRVAGTAPALPPHGEVRRVVVFGGSRGLLLQYHDGRDELNERLSGEGAAAQATGACEFWRWLGVLPGRASSAGWLAGPTDEDKPRLAGRESINGIECVKVTARQPRWGTETVWWVAPRYGYPVMRKDEVSYFQPGQGLEPGQHVVIRTRVRRVRPFAGGIYLPTEAERSVVSVNRDGSIASLLVRWDFVATQLTVNRPVAGNAFDLSKAAAIRSG